MQPITSSESNFLGCLINGQMIEQNWSGIGTANDLNNSSVNPNLDHTVEKIKHSESLNLVKIFQVGHQPCYEVMDFELVHLVKYSHKDFIQ